MRTSEHIKKIGLIVLAMLIFQTSFSQKNYLSGYIIRLSGDTLRGFIDYRNWGRNPDKISFKVKADDQSCYYRPTDINGFGVLDEFYESAIVETEESPENILNITDETYYESGLKLKADTAFLQTIIHGSKSLYSYTNKAGKYQFYIRQGSTYNLLIYKKYLVRTSTNCGIAENKEYINQLSAYLQDCPTIQPKLENTSYSLSGMEKLFLYYYACGQSKVEFQKKTEKTVVEFGVLAGVSLTSLKFDAVYYLGEADFEPSMKASAGLFMEIILPRNQRKWSLNNELVFSSYESTGRYDDYGNNNIYVNPNVYHLTIGLSYLKMNNMVRYNYPVGNSIIYLNGGISNGFAISETNYLKKEFNRVSPGTVVEGKALEEIRKYEQGFILGVGAKYKRLSIELRHERGNGMSVSSRITSTVNRESLLLGYRF